MRIALAALALATPAYADTITATTTTTVTVDTAPALDPPLSPPGEMIDRRAPEPPLGVPQYRLSVSAGAALGFDTKDKCGSGECIGVHVAVAKAIAPRLLVALGSSVMTVPGDDKGLHNGVHHVETVALQYWHTPRLWAEAGLGIGSKRSWSYEEPHDIVDFMNADGWAPAGSLAVGYAAWRNAGQAFDVEARFASTDDVHHTSFAQLLAGFSFF